MRIKLFVCVGVLFLAFSCGNNNLEGPELQKAICGGWQDAGLRIQMNTFANTDSVSIFEVKEKEWNKYMTVKPTRTFYLADGTFYAEHRNMQDSLILRPVGKWWINEDSLFVRDTFPNIGATYQYRVDMGKNSMRLYGLEDSDNDGKTDDDYLSTQKKIK